MASRQACEVQLKKYRHLIWEYGEFVHYGITTQDVVDTGQVLEIKLVIDLILRDLNKIEATLKNLTKRYQSTPMVGRSHGQYALPITFGLKTAVWYEEIKRHRARIESLAKRILVGQLSGPVGTYSALGDQGMAVCKLALEKLGLEFSPLAWHVARDNMAEFSSCCTIFLASLAKIANEIFQLGKTDVQELQESVFGDAVSSSAMPHKENPVATQRIIVLSRHIRALNDVVMESLVHEGERDPRALWSEWLAIPQISIYSLASLAYTLKLLNGLKVFPEIMLGNLEKQSEVIASEFLMFKLAPVYGKSKAHQKVYELMKEFQQSGQTIKHLIRGNPDYSDYLSEDDLEALDKVENYIGQSVSIINSIIK